MVPDAPVCVSGKNGTSNLSSISQRLMVIRTRRDLTVAERQDYIRAVKCLMTAPSTSTRRGVRSRFDEFQACHIDLTDEVHQVVSDAPFLCLLFFTDAVSCRDISLPGIVNSSPSTRRLCVRSAVTKVQPRKSLCPGDVIGPSLIASHRYWDWSRDADGTGRYSGPFGLRPFFTDFRVN